MFDQLFCCFILKEQENAAQKGLLLLCHSYDKIKLNTENSDSEMSHYLILITFYFNWMHFVARAVFTIIFLLCLKGMGIQKFFQVALKSVNKREVRSRQKSRSVEIIVFQYHTACFIMSPAPSNVSSGFWKKKTHTSWIWFIPVMMLSVIILKGEVLRKVFKYST